MQSDNPDVKGLLKFDATTETRGSSASTELNASDYVEDYLSRILLSPGSAKSKFLALSNNVLTALEKATNKQDSSIFHSSSNGPFKIAVTRFSIAGIETRPDASDSSGVENVNQNVSQCNLFDYESITFSVTPGEKSNIEYTNYFLVIFITFICTVLAIWFLFSRYFTFHHRPNPDPNDRLSSFLARYQAPDAQIPREIQNYNELQNNFLENSSQQTDSRIISTLSSYGRSRSKSKSESKIKGKNRRAQKVSPSRSDISSSSSPDSETTGYASTQRANPTLNEIGELCIGKISFDPQKVLGHGCQGTCVFRGRFENVQTCAVKRVVSQYLSLADREIKFLRSLQHPNLVRYLATEEDIQFVYIALELAEFTLAEFIENRVNCKNFNDESLKKISNYDLCYQSTLGLKYLHDMDIIHRDIKPQNILISFPIRPDNKRKVMISDFGVSKRISTNQESAYSSNICQNIDGTNGWIPAEVMKARLTNSSVLSPSKSVDIFSLGCVFYYIHTNGRHPFGELFDRQSNIINGINKLSSADSNFSTSYFSQKSYSKNIECTRLTTNSADSTNQESVDNYTADNDQSYSNIESSKEEGEDNLFSKINIENDILVRHLISTMISHKAELRPPIDAVLSYPLFWTKQQQLQFLQDVSDRIEKLDYNDDIIGRIEKGRVDVIQFCWLSSLSGELQQDLRKFRAYKKNSIRDLLRAIRNKKNHYRELPSELQKSLGNIPDEFTDYFTSRFPRLLPHVYLAMQMLRNESIFRSYYMYDNSSTRGDVSSNYNEKDIFVWPDLPRRYAPTLPTNKSASISAQAHNSTG